MPSYRSVLVLNAFLLCLSLAVYIYNNVPRKYLWLAVLLIFLNAEKNVYGNMVGIRNGLVVTGFILGASFIQNRKIIPFAILTILLSTFHTAALLFLPIAYLVGRNSSISSREILIWIIVIIALLAFSVSGLIELAAPIISHSFDRYEYYLEEMTAHRGVLLTSASLVLILLIFTLYNSQKIILTKEQNSTVRLGLLYVVSAFLGSLAMRANYFYDIFFIGTVVILFANSKRDDLKGLSLASLAVLMSAYSLYLWHTCKWVAGNPYYTIYTSIIGSW